jgi:hypothetical protein
MLGQLPTDEDPVPVIAKNGQPPRFDFFGLGTLHSSTIIFNWL